MEQIGLQAGSGVRISARWSHWHGRVGVVDVVGEQVFFVRFSACGPTLPFCRDELVAVEPPVEGADVAELLHA